MLAAWTHTRDRGWEPVAEVATISDRLGEPGCLLWAVADVATLTATDIGTIAEEFRLHPLALEDATSPRQRPKLEAYDTHLFAVLHQLDSEDGQLEAHQIASFIGRNFVVTVHHGAGRLIEETHSRLRRAARDSDQGPSFVMHALLDAVVDDYQTKADALEEEIEDIEDIVLGDPGTPLQQRIYSVKQRLARLRRYVVPGERVLGAALTPDRTDLITQRTAAAFRDVHDHTRRIIDQIANVQALVDAVAELQRTEQANALNEVTKRLTGWAAIIAVPTFIASVYGMNFELIPQESELPGFFFALAMMAASAIGLFVYFKRRRWI